MPVGSAHAAAPPPSPADRRPAILAEGVRKSFGAKEVLFGVDLAIPRGELYGLVGPNASGKTTLIRILLGLEPVSGGSARILGAAPGTTPGAIGYMPQEEALYPDLSVRENLRFFGGLYRTNVEARERPLLDFVRLWEDRDRPVGHLSGGMRRRVSLAVALLHEPQVLFLDEPTVGVDPLLRTEFWSGFQALADRGAAILITTHHLEEARRCDRVGFLWRGRVIREGPPRELMAAARAENLEEAFLWALREAEPGGP